MFVFGEGVEDECDLFWRKDGRNQFESETEEVPRFENDLVVMLSFSQTEERRL